MSTRGILLALAVIAAGGVCVRLGVWQLERRAEKHALHAAQQAALEAAPLTMSDSLLATPAMGVRVNARGHWDRRSHVLLSGRTHLGAAGVSLVTPFVLANGERILVERGWLPSADSRLADPEPDEPGLVEVAGVAQPFVPPSMATPWVALPGRPGGPALWSARALDADSARVRLGAPLASWVLRALPVPAPERPAAGASRGLRPEPEPFVVGDESMHLSYAIQWFAFAAVIVLGSLAFARRRR